MILLDRHIAGRFLANFVILFALLFIFAVSIDVIIQLDTYTKVAKASADQGTWYWAALAWAIFDFWGPRLAQFYAYMLGLVSVGAAGFTLSAMLRTRELVAIMSAGASLTRVAMVLIVVATGLNLLQLVNQEAILPRLAPLLVRTHDDLVRNTLRSVPVPLTRDGRGQLLLGQALDPIDGVIDGFLLIERDGRGVAVGRIEATRAAWSADRGGYELTEGRRYQRRSVDVDGRAGLGEEILPVELATTDLSPQALTIRRYAAYAQMLSLQQIRAMRAEGGVDPGMLDRLTYLRLGGIVVNLLVLILCIPFFLLREPLGMLRQSILASAVAIPGTLGSFLAMTVPWPGLSPAVGVFLPAAVLLPIALWRLGTIRT
jgi:lipopolysaccharide export LptBFGC system permease protein LptF